MVKRISEKCKRNIAVNVLFTEEDVIQIEYF